MICASYYKMGCLFSLCGRRISLCLFFLRNQEAKCIFFPALSTLLINHVFVSHPPQGEGEALPASMRHPPRFLKEFRNGLDKRILFIYAYGLFIYAYLYTKICLFLLLSMERNSHVLCLKLQVEKAE